MTSNVTEIAVALAQFRADLHDLQRRMEPYIEQYEAVRRIDTDEEERVFKALAMVWSAWWDITETIAYLRAADRRLRNEGGSLADTETER
jgi:Ser/Thr protein kinase RdoA (MazF antagonist)